jgi:hypothetical protein
MARRAQRGWALLRWRSVEPKAAQSIRTTIRAGSQKVLTRFNRARPRTRVARCSLRSRQPRASAGRPSGRPMTCAARRASKRCKAGTKERLRREQKNWGKRSKGKRTLIRETSPSVFPTRPVHEPLPAFLQSMQATILETDRGRKRAGSERGARQSSHHAQTADAM